ncbi:hypothetical protein KJ909_01125 [Patescibacteria group bacterium]|nr:hypothetical protein [Patescibacteria group bacterium]
MRVILPFKQNASELILIMMVSAIGTVLLTRLFLDMTSYPIIGGGKWHISHLFWGGILMLWGMILALITHGQKYKKIASVGFGWGLGWFIDESGKFLSIDNDYFFQPAIVVMYIFFVLMFLLYRFLERNIAQNPKTLLYQALADLEEITEKDLGKSKKRELIKKLNRLTKKTDPAIKFFVIGLKNLIVKIEAIEDKKERRTQRWWKGIKRFTYHDVFKKRFALIFLLVLALIYAIGGIYDAMIFGKYLFSQEWNGWMFGLKIFFDFLTSIFFMAGIYWVWRKKKSRGINYFRMGLLINIFLSSVFKFYLEQFSGVFSLVVSVVILTGLGRLRKEKII